MAEASCTPANNKITVEEKAEVSVRFVALSTPHPAPPTLGVDRNMRMVALVAPDSWITERRFRASFTPSLA